MFLNWIRARRNTINARTRQQFTHRSSFLKQPTSSEFNAACREILTAAARRQKAMRPSLSVLEPGLERGVPWGRDLYTFVTSAAGHMMRTLQKPRKNRPSKRQVNHRRFLHNMIQRKFADIEAANHRLASALYLKEGEKHASSLSSHKQDAPTSSGNPSQSESLQDSDKPSVQTEAEDISTSKTDISTDSGQAENRLKKCSDFGHFWESHDKYDSTTQMNSQRKRRQKKEGTNKLSAFSLINSPKYKEYFQEAGLVQSEYYQSQVEPINDLSDNLQAPPNSSSAHLSNQNEINSPPFSSELSPLSLDSCDFSVQMFTDLTGCSQDQKTTTEEQLADVVDLFSAGDSYSESCTEVEDYFDSNCSCQDEAALKVCADNVPGAEDPHSEGGEHRYKYSCQEEQSVSTDHCEDDQRSMLVMRQKEYTGEKRINNAKPSQSTNINSDLLSTYIGCGYNVTQLQTHELLQEGIQFNDLNVTPFEGVAQSFSAPPHHRVHRPIPTPPPDDDWMFRDILKDRQSPY